MQLQESGAMVGEIVHIRALPAMPLFGRRVVEMGLKVSVTGLLYFCPHPNIITAGLAQLLDLVDFSS